MNATATEFSETATTVIGHAMTLMPVSKSSPQKYCGRK
jgi:hypothetical protein